MLIQTIILFVGVAFLLFLLGKYYIEAKEAGPYLAGFILVILSILSMTSGIEVKNGENCLNETNSTCIETRYTYSNLGDVEKVSISTVFLASGLLLFFTGYNDRKERLETLK